MLSIVAINGYLQERPEQANRDDCVGEPNCKPKK
jgi:hypothetical protein